MRRMIGWRTGPLLRGFLLMGFLALATLLAPAAQAHRQPEVETVIERGEGITGSVLKVTHRLHAHDAKRVLAVMPDAMSSDLEDPKNQARLALYAKRRFRFEGTTESEMIGVEIDGNYLFIYQEHPVVASVASSTLLSDISPDWTNRVMVRGMGGTVVRTMIFRQGQESVGR